MADRLIPGSKVTDFNFKANFDTAPKSEVASFQKRDFLSEQSSNSLSVKTFYEFPERRANVTWQVYTTFTFTGITGTTGYSGQTGFTGTTGVTSGITTGTTSGSTSGSTSGGTTGRTAYFYDSGIVIVKDYTLPNTYYKDFRYTFQGDLTFNYEKLSWNKIQTEIINTGANLSQVQQSTGMNRGVLRKALFSGILKLKRFYNR